MGTGKINRIFLFFIKLLLTIGILGLIIAKTDIELILKTFISPDINYLIIALFLIFPNFIIKFLKWYYLLKVCNIPVPLLDVSKSYLAGLTFGLITPARAGEIGRALFLGENVKLRGAGVVIIDKLIDLTGILLISLFGVKLIFSQSSFLLLSLVVLAGIIALFSLNSFSPRIHALIPNSAFGSKFREVIAWMNFISIKVILISLLLTLTMYFIILLQCHVLIKAFYNIPISLNIIFFAFPLVILSNILPITIGGIGVREGVAVLCLSSFHVPGEVAVTATFYLFIINVVIPSLLGAIFIFHHYLKHI